MWGQHPKFTIKNMSYQVDLSSFSNEKLSYSYVIFIIYLIILAITGIKFDIFERKKKNFVLEIFIEKSCKNIIIKLSSYCNSFLYVGLFCSS